jgi:hypothetical protein
MSRRVSAEGVFQKQWNGTSSVAALVMARTMKILAEKYPGRGRADGGRDRTGKPGAGGNQEALIELLRGEEASG